MENKTHYTRCPHCNSAFKITLEVLSRAQGKARCGACLAIFQATDYLLQPRKEEVASEFVVATKVVKPKETPKPAVKEDKTAAVKAKAKATNKKAPSNKKVAKIAVTKKTKPKVKKEPKSLPDVNEKQDGFEFTEKSTPALVIEEPAPPKTVDVPSTAEKISEDGTLNQISEEKVQIKEEEKLVESEPVLELGKEDEVLVEEDEKLAEEDEKTPIKKPSNKQVAAEVMANISQVDPLEEFDEKLASNKHIFRNLLITLVIVIQLVIAGYKFWDHRQELAWDETWGGFTQWVCSMVECDIKPRRDVSKIRLRQRIITPIEDDENRLDIKILITNEADFDQPYPRITIKFSNSLGDPVSSKQFMPADYFPEKHDRLMPADTEVHISFETELPHPDALGFEFVFD